MSKCYLMNILVEAFPELTEKNGIPIPLIRFKTDLQKSLFKCIFKIICHKSLNTQLTIIQQVVVYIHIIIHRHLKL